MESVMGNPMFGSITHEDEAMPVMLREFQRFAGIPQTGTVTDY